MDRAHVLVVEDEPVSRELLASSLQEAGYQTSTAESGAEAWYRLTSHGHEIDVIVLDRVMPDMDGMEILRGIKAEPALAQVPVIMQTCLSSEADIADGLRAGAYYYLTKPFSGEMLLAIVAAAANDRRDYKELQGRIQQAARSLVCINEAEFQFNTPEQARDIAALLANVSPTPQRIVLGLCELMLNAVEHGNLGITYDEKSELIHHGRLFTEISTRLQSPQHAHKKATLRFERSAGELRFLISDQGGGFEWQRYLEISPERAFDNHGRGIAMAKLISFDKLEYHGCGNEVLAIANA